MIFPKTKLEVFLDKYPGLSVKERPCLGCGTPLHTTRPFVEGAVAGLIAPKCPCGKSTTLSIMVGRTPEVSRKLSVALSHLYVM
jgi:hypothetical protein